MPDAGLAVVADVTWGMHCLAYNVQGQFSDAALQEIALLQNEVLTHVPLPLNVSPPHALHLSIYAPVPVRWPDSGKGDYWQEIAARTRADLEDLCTSQRSFTLHFDTLRVSPSAIIAVASGVPELVAAIRERFSQAPGHPCWPRPMYDIAHTTLARFSADGVLPEPIIHQLSTKPISVMASVIRIQLVRETVYPSLQVDTLTSYDLAPD